MTEFQKQLLEILREIAKILRADHHVIVKSKEKSEK